MVSAQHLSLMEQWVAVTFLFVCLFLVGFLVPFDPFGPKKFQVKVPNRT